MGLSVSRVGGSAQIKAMKKVAGTLRIDLAQYREMEAFAQYASDLDKSSRDQLARGERMVEILKQPQYQPLPVSDQVLVIYAATHGHLDALPLPQVSRYESELRQYAHQQGEALLAKLSTGGALDDQMSEDLDKLIAAFDQTFQAN